MKFYSNLQLLKMISNHNALILSLLSLVVSTSSLWTEERRETSRNQLSEENITRALIDMTQETLLRSFGIDVSRKPSKAFTPHDYMIDIYSVLSGDSDAARRTRINTVRGIMDTGKWLSSFLQFPVSLYWYMYWLIPIISSVTENIELSPMRSYRIVITKPFSIAFLFAMYRQIRMLF